MKTKRLLTILGIVLLAFLCEDLNAQGRVSKNHKTSKARIEHHKGNRYRTQPIRRSYHRYPRHRRYVRTLPYGCTRLYFGGLNYYFHAGIYYTYYSNSYVVVLPPAGFRISILPSGYARILVGPHIYFYHSGIYYLEVKDDSNKEAYEVTQPPVGGIIDQLPKDAEEVEIEGQILYDHNGILYKKIGLDGGDIGYEIVYVSKETSL